MASPDFLKVGKEETPLIFLFAWHIARQHYVTARVSLQEKPIGLEYSGCLLAQQSLELFVKAILHLDNQSIRGHDIRRLMQNGRAKVPYFDKLLNDQNLCAFLDSLLFAYLTARFGERALEIKVQEFCQALDEVAYNLDKCYKEISQPLIVQRVRVELKNGLQTTSYEHHESPLYVPTALKEAFLQNNKYFTEKDISDNFMASMPMP